ncbi:MAG: ATP synthase F1 subunit gamma [Candidatus Eisenbacteria bacterium]|uniref:ATP synthase gamma chain n=1 Tax=Eiseniibacteriota bacterium TaxID=2212470 RepID=A0A849SFG5_UNCEI|nr:ATP synthase F1 subunit gamma [Candidatus Eisenbacteria bacterium]
MASLKDLRRRIRATKNMQQIFKAMEMVSAAKLRRAQQRAQAASPYAAKITEMLANLAGSASELEHPLFKVREVKTTALVVVTSQRGFCGAYNSNLIRATEQRLRAAAPGTIQLVLIGKKGNDYFRRRNWPILAAYTDLPGEANLEFARRIMQDLTEHFTSGTVDRVEVMYSHFLNALSRKIVTEVFLPVGASESQVVPQDRGTIFEPDPEIIFGELLPRYASAKLYAGMADALACEYSARMVAMGSARKNAGELVDSLTLTRNRLRQAAITKEIAELVGGVEALK